MEEEVIEALEWSQTGTLPQKGPDKEKDKCLRKEMPLITVEEHTTGQREEVIKKGVDKSHGIDRKGPGG